MATLGTFSAGQVLTAAEMNAIGTWTSFTPSYFQFTLGNGTNNWWYSIVNKIMFISGSVTLGSTSSMGTNPRFTLPASVTGATGQGVSHFYDAAVPYTGTCIMTGTTFFFFSISTSGSFAGRGSITATAPFTWATGDLIEASCVGLIA